MEGSSQRSTAVTEPLVSVLVPVYNHARYVRQCLDSLLSEGWPNLEVLVLDDGSSDGSFEVVRCWRIDNPEAFTRFELMQQPNQGLPRSLNRLISLARGEYITLLASDDYLLPGGIKARVNSLIKHPEWLAVFGDCEVVDAQGNKLKNSGITQLYPQSLRLKALIDPTLLELELILRWSIPGPVLLLRSETYKKLGCYDESLFIEDRDFYLRLLSVKALGFLSSSVAAYRMHAQNFIRSSGERQKRQLEDLASSANKNTRRFDGLSRLALYVDYRRLSSSDWRSGNLIYKVGAFWWRALWKGLDYVQSFRLKLRQEVSR